MERRGSTRTRYRLPTEIVHAGVRHHGFLVDVSPRGAFIQTTRTLDPESEIELRFADDQLAPQVARARVKRRRNVPAAAASVLRGGIGIEWIDAPQFARELGDGGGIEVEIEGWEGGDSWVESEPQSASRPGLEPVVPIGEIASASASAEEGAVVEVVAPSDTRLAAAAGAFGEIALTDAPPLVEETLELGPVAVRADVAVIDEGELAGVDEIVRSLGARTLRMRWGAQADPVVWGAPPRLVVVSARVAMAVPLGDAVLGAGALGIAVCDSGACTLRARLRRQGYEWVVHRSAHPETLRLLFASLLSRHVERRKQGRRAFGAAAMFWRGFRRARAALLELSASGASLLVASELPPGVKLTVRVPAKHAGGRSLALPCEVVRAARSAHGTVLGLRYAKQSARKKARVAALVSELAASGPVPFESAGGRVASAAHGKRERRRSGRARVAQQALALDASSRVAHDILFGTELSLGGMRIEPHPRLERGAELQLALQPPGGAPPVMLSAEVVRDEGVQGLVLRFRKLSTTAKRAVECMLATAAEVERTRLTRAGHGERVVLGTLVETTAARLLA